MLAGNIRKAESHVTHEARRLPVPEGANFIKMFLRGRYQAPPIGLTFDARSR
jgi:hypothetical protein